MENKKDELDFATDGTEIADFQGAYDALALEFQALEVAKQKGTKKLNDFKDQKAARKQKEAEADAAAKELFDDDFDAAKLAYDTAFDNAKADKDAYADLLAGGGDATSNEAMVLLQRMEEAEEGIREKRANFDMFVTNKADREAREWQEAELLAQEEADKVAQEDKRAKEQDFIVKKDAWERAKTQAETYGDKITAMEATVGDMDNTDPLKAAALERIDDLKEAK